MLETISQSVEAVVNFVLPLACVHCSEEGSLFCERCASAAPTLPGNSCVKCGERTSEHLDLCGDCFALPPPLDRLVPKYRYGGSVRSAIHALKYRHITAIAPAMASLMSELRFLHRAKLDCIVPVPIHANRLRERGYNQAAHLAQPLAEFTGKALIEDALIKIRDTQSQVELSRSERMRSLTRAFIANYSFDDAHVLLVDDVCTTGSTLMNCAVALKRAGARRVSAVVFAKETFTETTEEAS